MMIVLKTSTIACAGRCGERPQHDTVRPKEWEARRFLLREALEALTFEGSEIRYCRFTHYKIFIFYTWHCFPLTASIPLKI